MRFVSGSLALLYKCYIGCVFFAFLIVFFPIFYILLSVENWRKLSFPIFVLWSYYMRFFLLTWIIKKGVKPMINEPSMIIANHTSYLDIFLMYSLFPNHPFVFMGKSEILSYPLIRLFFKKLNIPVHRGDTRKAAQSFIQAKNALANGWSVVIFPEGGIPDENLPCMIPFKAGAFKLAKSAKVPIVSLTFLNNYKLFSDPTQVFGPARPGPSKVVFHPVVSKETVLELSELELSHLVFSQVAEPLIQNGFYPNM